MCFVNEPDTKEHVLLDSTYMVCPETADLQRLKQIRVAWAGCWKGSRHEVSSRGDGKVLSQGNNEGCTTL